MKWLYFNIILYIYVINLLYICLVNQKSPRNRAWTDLKTNPCRCLRFAFTKVRIFLKELKILRWEQKKDYIFNNPSKAVSHGFEKSPVFGGFDFLDEIKFLLDVDTQFFLSSFVHKSDVDVLTPIAVRDE